jgi:hypothetical protein
VSVLTIRKKRGDPRRVNKYQYSTLIILWLATTTRGLSGLMLSLLELLDPESENSVRHTFFLFERSSRTKWAGKGAREGNDQW